MTIKVSSQLRQQIQQEQIEYGLSGDIGGLPKTTYYTPDGRIIRTTVNFHTNQAGQVRDANLDKGWLLAPLGIPKLFCKWCDKWHDTQKEIVVCKKRMGIFINKEAVKANQEEAEAASAMKKRIKEFEAMERSYQKLIERMAKLEVMANLMANRMEVKGNGQVLQQGTNESAQVPAEQGAGATKEGL